MYYAICYRNFYERCVYCRVPLCKKHGKFYSDCCVEGCEDNNIYEKRCKVCVEREFYFCKLCVKSYCNKHYKLCPH